jgi:hypothetical protein
MGRFVAFVSWSFDENALIQGWQRSEIPVVASELGRKKGDASSSTTRHENDAILRATSFQHMELSRMVALFVRFRS